MAYDDGVIFAMLSVEDAKHYLCFLHSGFQSIMEHIFAAVSLFFRLSFRGTTLPKVDKRPHL